MTVIKFTKLHGAGNDFVVLDGRNAKRNWSIFARRVCDRHFGIGADGLIIAAESGKADLRMRMFNPDGSEAETCGNGLRCLVKYAVEKRLIRSSSFTIETGAGVSHIKTRGTQGTVRQVMVEMAVPRFSAADLPVTLRRKSSASSASAPIIDYPLSVSGIPLSLTFVSMGNPHAVHFINRPVAGFPLPIVGPAVENHRIFPKRTNFEVARVIDRRHIELRVWERGAGETLACGSGACAAAVAAQLHGFCGDKVKIILPGGTLTVSWSRGGPVYLEGPTIEVFAGELHQ